jgi:hypothetical protein
MGVGMQGAGSWSRIRSSKIPHYFDQQREMRGGNADFGPAAR